MLSEQNEDSKKLKYVNLHGLEPAFFEINRKKFFSNLKAKLPDFDLNSLLVLEGGKEIPRHDTDTVFYHFIQENYFYYLSGVEYPNFHLLLDLKSEEITLFLEIPSERYKIFMHVLSPEEASKRYGLPCLPETEIVNFITKRNPNNVYRLKGTNSDSGLEFKKFDFSKNFPLSKFMKEETPREEKQSIEGAYNAAVGKIIDSETLTEVLADTRVVKSNEEVELLRFTSEKTCEAHIEVMKGIKNGHYERDAENIFINYLRTNFYTRDLPYFPICGCCEGSATLHYVKNDVPLKNGDIFLLDMGARLGGYCSDITQTIPVNGKYSKKQKEIYDTVLSAAREVMKNLKAGVRWSEMHLLAERVIITNLQKFGVLNQGFSVDEMLEKRVCSYFMPHGLGHLLGLEVHDVGGYLSFTNERICQKGLRSLRTNRNLLANTVVTVEPGCYFVAHLLEQAFADEDLKKYFNSDLIVKEYYGFGGVRIEDVVLVKENDCENLSKNLPRETEEIEKIMAS